MPPYKHIASPHFTGVDEALQTFSTLQITVISSRLLGFQGLQHIANSYTTRSNDLVVQVQTQKQPNSETEKSAYISPV